MEGCFMNYLQATSNFSDSPQDALIFEKNNQPPVELTRAPRTSPKRIKPKKRAHLRVPKNQSCFSRSRFRSRLFSKKGQKERRLQKRASNLKKSPILDHEQTNNPEPIELRHSFTHEQREVGVGTESNSNPKIQLDKPLEKEKDKFLFSPVFFMPFAIPVNFGEKKEPTTVTSGSRDLSSIVNLNFGGTLLTPCFFFLSPSNGICVKESTQNIAFGCQSQGSLSFSSMLSSSNCMQSSEKPSSS